ncbi:MAG: hypothetical protein PHD01_11965 [Geobacteraceae bacterium]|nr:hypothetical protein [Geobacteraceae bacterium]
MGLGCGDEWRQKHPKWCSMLDGVLGSTWAAAPDPTGVVAVGTAALDPNGPTSAIVEAVRRYNIKMAYDDKDDNIDVGWAQQHPMKALKELKRRGY